MRTNLPTQSSSHKKEKVSRLEFQKAMGDWIVYSFQQVEYGIDSIVEITQNRSDTDDDDVTNIRFSVQIKATAQLEFNKNLASFRVPVVKINYWSRGNLPTLLAVYDISKQIFYYRWIDLELTNELDKKRIGWREQESTTIDIFENCILSKDSLPTLAEYVFGYKRSNKRIIPAGTFLSLKQEINHIIRKVQDLNNTFPFASITSQSNVLQEQLEKALYKVTITGQTKAGKSSFINALLKRYISTVDILPLTGIPMNFIPSNEEYSEIVLQENKIKGPVSEDFLRKYISKSENKGNHLGVKTVNVHIQNHQLENGVCFSDVPGIDDLEERVQNYTWSTIDQSNAILYLIDAFPFEGGGQVFNFGTLNDLKKLERTKNIDKVFIVFNKVDGIKSHPIARLKKFIESTFEEHGISKIVHSKIFYISAEKSYKIRMGNLKRGEDSVALVEKELWNFILNENKIGVYKLQKLVSETNIICNNYTTLIEASLNKDEKLTGFVKDIAKAKTNFPNIKNRLVQRRNELQNDGKNYILSRKEQVMSKLRAKLENSSELPSIAWVKNYMINELKTTRSLLNQNFTTSFLHLKTEVDVWVEENLQKVRGRIVSKTEYNVDLKHLNNFNVEDLNSSSVAWGLLNAGLLLLAIEIPPLAAVLGILSLLGWASTAAERKQRKIRRIMERANQFYQNECDELIDKSNSTVATNITNLYNYGYDRLNIFLTDLEREISKIDSEPISLNDRNKLSQNLKEIEKIKTSIQEMDQKLKLEYF